MFIWKLIPEWSARAYYVMSGVKELIRCFTVVCLLHYGLQYLTSSMLGDLLAVSVFHYSFFLANDFLKIQVSIH